MRFPAILLVTLLVAPVIWLREPPQPPDYRQQLDIEPVPLPDPAIARAQLGPFRLEGIWRLTSPHTAFGSYSALAPLPDGRLLAVSDRGYWLRFSPPGAGEAAPRFGAVIAGNSRVKVSRDIEAAAVDPASGTIWLGWEGRNAITRHAPDWSTVAWVRPRAMRRWSVNSGPEAMVRLHDGRFLVVQEGGTGRHHIALLFPDDPVRKSKPMRFLFEGPDGFSPTDAAQLPDGRVLILMRRLVWPMPFRFVARIALADPAEIRAGAIWRASEIARIGSLLPADNFEGLAIVPRWDGTVTAWIISDDNQAVSQRTLLWKLALDPAALSHKPTQKGAEQSPAPLR